MSDGGYEHDLRDAENAMAAAGHPDIALGMRRHSEAQRNMMQGVLVPMFVQMVERTLAEMLKPLLVGQKETQDGVVALGNRFQVVEQNVHTLTAQLEKLETRMHASEDDRAAIWKQLKEIKQILAARPAQREIEHKAILDAIAERGG